MESKKPLSKNPAADLLGRILRIKHPKTIESSYTYQGEALMKLRKISGLTVQQMALKLGISVPQYDKSESGQYGGNMSIDQLSKAMKLALQCNLPQMAAFFRLLHASTRGKPKRGPKANESDWWKNVDMKSRT